MKNTLFALALLAVACGSTPTAPGTMSIAVRDPALAGRWRGIFQLTSCAGSFGNCNQAPSAEFMLTLVPSGPGLEGVLVLLDNDRTTMNLTGVPRGDGYDFTATGFSDQVPDTWPPRTVVSSIAIRSDSTVGITGAITYTNQTFASTARTVELRSAIRLPDAVRPGNFDGNWDGYYRTISCTGDCQVGGGGYNFPAGGHLSMKLSDAAGRVAGSVLSQPVNGTSTLNSLTVTGAALSDDKCAVCWDCEGVCQQSVRNVVARVDKLDRMSGSFEYSLKGWTGSQHFRQVMLVEMVNVTRRW